MNKSVFITGANGGMGIETIKKLIDQKVKRIVMACRTDQKAVNARSEVITTSNTSDTKLEAYGGFDMTNPTAIELAVNSLPSNQVFDIVFLQAGGVIFTKEFQYIQISGLKFEKTIFQNVIGPYITLFHLYRRGLIAPDARIVYAGGEGARGIPGMMEKPEFQSTKKLSDYILGKNIHQKYNPMSAMGISKLMGALMVTKLSKTLPQTSEILWFSPGLTYGTNGLASKPKLERWFLEKVGFGMMALLGMAQSPERAAQKYVDSLTAKVGKNGDIIGAPQGKALGKLSDQKPMNSAFTDQNLIDEFWKILSENFSPIDFKSDIRV
ncbi:Rossmann-fold NAD(P)-binding domain-containing protein [Sediminitomix flava]|uniref:NAD(P)-dependent dehydrogenase (Short-subunit alcohol dehydrogenase family) n=1 Tax=Sediminitomix flava TaxID=379075 RepID=A0A315Z7W7_SEDFL|nr:hypothetical protein [Sediminitomix flava]PWJ40141.1 hypothetical protein BC781_105209 [Sediminitomix flava]